MKTPAVWQLWNALKKIDELLENLHGTFHRLRHSSIDEELYDVIAGYESLLI